MCKHEQDKNSHFYYKFCKLGQLNEIKKQTLSAVVCRNFDVTSVQPHPFFKDTIDFLVSDQGSFANK